MNRKIIGLVTVGLVSSPEKNPRRLSVRGPPGIGKLRRK